MGTANKSESYNRDRSLVRRWLLETREGQFATEMANRGMPKGDNLSRLFDDDKWLDWEDLYKESKDSIVLAANCREAREGARMAMKSTTSMVAPTGGPSKMMRFFSPPMSHVLRRQIEVQDPDYWNDPKNVLREALLYPEYACVPESLLRAQLESMLPKGTKVTMTKGGVLERREGKPAAGLDPDPDTGTPANAQKLLGGTPDGA